MSYNFEVNEFINFGKTNEIDDQLAFIDNLRKFSQDTSENRLFHTKIDRNCEITINPRNHNSSLTPTLKSYRIREFDDDDMLSFGNVNKVAGLKKEIGSPDLSKLDPFELNDTKEDFSSVKLENVKGKFPNKNNQEIIELYSQNFSSEKQNNENSQKVNLQIIPFTKAQNTFMTEEGNPAALKIVINKSNTVDLFNQFDTNESTNKSFNYSQLFDHRESNKASLSKDNQSTNNSYKITISKTEHNFSSNNLNYKSSAEQKSDSEYSKMINKAKKLRSYWSKENLNIPAAFKIHCHEQKNQYFELNDLSCKNLMSQNMQNLSQFCSEMNADTDYNEDSILTGKRSKIRTEGKLSVGGESINFSSYKALKT